MISFDFDYYKATKIEEAYDLMMTLMKDNHTPVYYSGGTELLTSFRKNTTKSDTLIDIKTIEGIQNIKCDAHEILIGSCVSLNKVIESFDNSSLKDVLITIADHTVRNAITLGGNLCGRLPFKEALLPLLALKAEVVYYTRDGLITKPLSELFDKRLKLEKGDLLYQFKLKTANVDQFITKRITESTDTDYPLVHVLVSKQGQSLFIGLSGYASYPVYHEFDLSDVTVSKVFEHFKQSSKADIRGSKAYREHMLLTALNEVSNEMEGFNG